MMRLKKKLSVKWIWLIIVGFGVLIYLLPREIEQLLGLPQTTDAVNIVSQSSDPTGHPKAVKKALSGQVIGAQQSDIALHNESMVLVETKSNSAQVSSGMGSLIESTGAQNNSPDVQIANLNQIPTNNQAAQGIGVSSQQVQDLQKAMADRNDKIEQTHKAVMAAGVDAKSTNVTDNGSGATNDQSEANVVGSQEWIMTHRFVVRSGGPSK